MSPDGATISTDVPEGRATPSKVGEAVDEAVRTAIDHDLFPAVIFRVPGGVTPAGPADANRVIVVVRCVPALPVPETVMTRVARASSSMYCSGPVRTGISDHNHKEHHKHKEEHDPQQHELNLYP